MGLSIFKKKEILTLDSGEIYRWYKGMTLKATEKSAFIIPRAICDNGKTLSEMIELSDETEIVIMEERKDDIGVILEPGDTCKLNRNCEVIHIHITGEEKHKKNFIVKH
jgi:hypothetical protein